MDLFTRLTQQAFDNVPQQVVPRLPVRFEQNSPVSVAVAAGVNQRNASELQAVTSNIQATPSNVQATPSNVQAIPSNVQAPTSNVQAITSNIQAPTSNVQTTPSNVQGVDQQAGAFEEAAAERSNAHHSMPLHGTPQRMQAQGTVQQANTPSIQPALPARVDVQFAATPNTPNIHVSIGRIEVRALVRTPEPPRRERVQEPKPAQPLDEYLRGGRGQ